MAKSKKSKDDLIDYQDIWKKAVQEKINEVYTPIDGNIADVLVFCEKILNIELNSRPYMRLILKMYYMNSLGNEHLKIEDEDIEQIKSINNMGHGNPWLLKRAEQLRDGTITQPFQFLVLVLGRRSGKTFISSIILSYEIYKLLCMIVCPKCKDIKNVKTGEACPDCNTPCLNQPQAYYKLLGNEPMRLFLAATALKQALDPGLTFVKQRVNNSKWFDDKFRPEIETLHFQTDLDRQLNEKWRKMGLPEQEKGAVFIKAVAANSSSAHGTGTICLLLDEFALFNKSTDAKESDDALLQAMLPQTLAYRFRGDGRVIMISMPEGEEGKFHQYYKLGQKEDEHDILMFQMPTWEYNPDYTYETCLATWKNEDEDGEGAFDKLYGAQFASNGEEVYFPASLVEQAFNGHEYRQKQVRWTNAHVKHYMHIDCAYNSDNYAYVIVHTEYRHNPKTNAMDLFYVQDDSYFWMPMRDVPGTWKGSNGEIVDINGILVAIANKAKAFRITSISYDNMQSLESQSFFRSHGIPVRQLAFNGKNKGIIYANLRHALSGERVILCSDDERLKDEMKALRVHYSQRGAQIECPKHGKIKNDDVVDCLAGACFAATQKVQKTRTKMSVVPNGNFNYGGQGNMGSPAGSIFQRGSFLRSYNGGSNE